MLVTPRLTLSVLSILTSARALASRVRASSLVNLAFWGLADQGLQSLMNFVTMLLLAREVSRSSFGEFTLVYTGLLFANSFLGSLITQPHNVLGATRTGDDYKSYTSTCALGQAGLSLVFAGAIGLAAVAAATAGWGVATLLALLAPTIFVWQTQEFFRRVLYTELRPQMAFVNDLVSYGGQGAGVILLWRMGEVSATNVLIVIALTSFAACILGVFQLRNSFASRIRFSYLKENWRFGSWLAGASLGYWISNQSYRFILAIMLGTQATALAAAADICMRPLGVVVNAFESILPTRFARTIQAGGRLPEEVRRIVFLTFLPVTLYALFVVGFGQHILDVLYGGRYQDAQVLLDLFAVYYILLNIGVILSSLLRAGQSTRLIFWLTFGSTVYTVVLGWVFVHAFGVEGAIIGTIVNSVAFSLIVIRSRTFRMILGGESRLRVTPKASES
jgi:O-antigen/teichoic acid export membrane protein